jgi:dihydroneopterin aldolase
MLGGAAAIPTEFRMPMAEERVTRAGRVSSSGTGTDAPYDRVFVHDLVLDAEIGVYTHEKGVTQRARFSVDIEVTPADQAIEDQIGRVLDYDTIIDTIKDILAEGHINLVETLADEIASRCLAHPRAASVKVKIEKLDKEPGAVGVEIVRRRVRT